MNRPSLAITRLLYATQFWFLLLMWVGCVVGVVLIVAGVALFRDITVSGWDQAVQVIRWLALGYGTYLTGRLLSQLIAHGQTRRDFMIHVSGFVTAVSAVLAGLMTVGYLVERLIYRALGWPHKVDDDRLFTSSTDVAPIYISYLVLFLVWTIIGAMLGAAFYRLEAGGALFLPVALVLALGSGMLIRFGGLPLFSSLPDLRDLPLAAIVGLGALIYAAGVGITWALVRDLPVRSATG